MHILNPSWIGQKLSSYSNNKPCHKKAHNGEIKDMTGVQDIFVEPLNLEVVIDIVSIAQDFCVDHFLAYLDELNIKNSLNARACQS